LMRFGGGVGDNAFSGTERSLIREQFKNH